MKKKTLNKIVAPALALGLLVPVNAQAADHTPTASTPAGDLRATLDQLLSEHYVLAVTSMMKGYDEAADAEVADQALDQNALDMTPAIASIYGEEGAAQFEEIFRGHNDYSDDFVEAAKSDNQELRMEAEAEVDEFVEEFSTFLDAATEGNLPKEAAADALELHEDQVLSVFDNYVEGDYEEAYMTFREGYKHMFNISKALSGAIVTQMPDKFTTGADTPAVELRSTLNSLAGEHFALAAIGMQKGYDQAEDYDYVTWAEDQNTLDFKAAIASVYGDEGAAQFEKVWNSDHITAQGDIVAATLEGDEAKIEEARMRLDQFAVDFSTFLDAATEGNLPQAAGEEAIKQHETLVLDTFDQYVAGDAEAAWMSFREGYAFMFGVGETLGNAIVTQMPDKFEETMMPEEMPETGLGGAQEQSMNTLYAGLAVLGGILLAFVTLRKRKVSEQ
ncbi:MULTISPECIES: copper amine oxidase [unclassified Exiguobacterium]|uniref:copper amine oxidase n=1 Tax=unclassified Exiguobacterium TaxID=2644629 RepID=UPI00237BFDCF|nr:copper amine oxidase [Exiguobacterium sp. B2(2022)]MDE0563513.1 copper amine oxidase [Exiguobacterium sp. B2(2022)]